MRKTARRRPPPKRKRSISSSRAHLARWGLVALALLAATAAGLYVLQNSAGGRGGAIAPVKALWLLTVITFWYLLPALFALDKTLPPAARLAGLALFANMAARGIVELWLMYVRGSWQHVYGIVHDLASLVLCCALAYATRRQRWLALFFVFCAVLFAVESYFASYLRRITGADGTVFFLPSSDAHAPTLHATGWVVAAAVAVGVWVFRRWMNGPTARASSDD